eukprot:c23929_g1_i6 orf=197-589(-)
MNQSKLSMEMEQEPACPSQALVFDFAGDLHQHQHGPHPHEEVNVCLCLTCGSPVFRDADKQESDLTLPFCLHCLTMFSSRNSTSDDSDHEDHGHFHFGRVASSTAFQGHNLPSCMGFGSAIGGKTVMSTS